MIGHPLLISWEYDDWCLGNRKIMKNPPPNKKSMEGCLVFFSAGCLEVAWRLPSLGDFLPFPYHPCMAYLPFIFHPFIIHLPFIIHVWYISMGHLVDFLMVNVGKYTSPMDPMGSAPPCWGSPPSKPHRWSSCFPQQKIKKCHFLDLMFEYIWDASGQIIIFHQPRFSWNEGISLPELPFRVRSCDVAIIWPFPPDEGLRSTSWCSGRPYDPNENQHLGRTRWDYRNRRAPCGFRRKALTSFAAEFVPVSLRPHGIS